MTTSHLRKALAITPRVLTAAILCWAGILASLPVLAQSVLDRPIRAGTPSAIPLRIMEFKPEVYLITGRGGNSVVRNTSEGPVLVDTKVMYNVVWDELTSLIAERVSDKPLQLAFITHHHANHTGNNQRVIDTGADLVGHENVVEILRTYKSIIAPINPAPPTITFDDQIDFNIGGVRIRAIYWGSAHTDADIAIHLPDDEVVIAGDLLYHSGDPAVDTIDGRGSLLGMRQRLDDLLELEFEIAVPGHGDNVMTRAEVELYRDRFDTLVERGIAAVERGVGPNDLRAAMRSDDLGFRLVGHFWADVRFMRVIHEELAAEVERRRAATNQ